MNQMFYLAQFPILWSKIRAERRERWGWGISRQRTMPLTSPPLECIKWIKILYELPTTKVNAWFSLLRRNRKGCHFHFFKYLYRDDIILFISKSHTAISVLMQMMGALVECEGTLLAGPNWN